jgi:hypothetical protein
MLYIFGSYDEDVNYNRTMYTITFDKNYGNYSGYEYLDQFHMFPVDEFPYYRFYRRLTNRLKELLPLDAYVYPRHNGVDISISLTYRHSTNKSLYFGYLLPYIYQAIKNI